MRKTIWNFFKTHIFRLQEGAAIPKYALWVRALLFPVWTTRNRIGAKQHPIGAIIKRPKDGPNDLMSSVEKQKKNVRG